MKTLRLQLRFLVPLLLTLVAAAVIALPLLDQLTLRWFARDLSFNFFGWPFSFYMGAQGSLIVYVLIIWFYARYMNNLDHEYGVQEEEEE